MKNEVDLGKLREEIRQKVYSNNLLTDPDGETIFYAKQIARRHKVKYQDILSGMRPCGKIRGKVWDETGKVVPYSKVFGR